MSKKAKVICTYHADLPGHALVDERKLLSLWDNSWRAIDWETHILNESHARKHPDFEAYEKKIATFPTVNTSGYERACHMRWLAIVAACGGGFMCDFDIIPRRDWERDRNLPRKATVFQGWGVDNACPSLAWATAKEYDAYIAFVLTQPDGLVCHTVDGKTHTSDMFLWRMFAATGGAQVDRKIWLFNEDGWMDAPLIHFSRGSMHPAGHSPRWQFIPELLKRVPQS